MPSVLTQSHGRLGKEREWLSISWRKVGKHYHQCVLKRGTKGSRGDLQSAFALLLPKQTAAFVETMVVFLCCCWAFLFVFPPFVCLFLPAWQSAGAVEPGLQDGALALAVSHRVSLDLIHAGVQTFLVRLVSGGRGGVREGEIKPFVKCKKAAEQLQAWTSQDLKNHTEKQMDFL